MKKILCFIALFFGLSCALPVVSYSSENVSWDGMSDQRIEACFQSNTFQNISLMYSYEHRNWEILLVFNPQREQIQLNSGQRSMIQFYYGVFTREDIPQGLENQINGIIERVLGSSSGGYWGIASLFNGALAIDYFAGTTAINGTAKPKPNNQNMVPQETNASTPNEANGNNAEISGCDLEIIALLSAPNFGKLSLDYEWEGKTYQVHFVCNPERTTLLGSGLSQPVRWPLAMTIDASTYPLPLAKHLKSLVPSDLLNDSDSVIDVADWVSYRRKNSVSTYTSLCPIFLLDSIENPVIDAEIQDLFISDKLVTKHLSYELEGTTYCVLLIHNPEKVKLKSKCSFTTWAEGRLWFTISWSKKVGIFVDRKAPQELIDHLSGMYTLSWWDNMWNHSIYNGDKVVITRTSGFLEYTYSPYTWYTFIKYAKP